MATTLAERIQRAAKLRGYTSDKSSSGVDVKALASATGSSYEMARRYADGTATPSPDGVHKMAGWLRVSPTWLLYGEGQMEGNSDITILEACLVAAADAQRISGIKLTEPQRARLAAALYRQAQAGTVPSADSVAAAMLALAK